MLRHCLSCLLWKPKQALWSYCAPLCRQYRSLHVRRKAESDKPATPSVTTPVGSGPLRLRDYQEECIQSVLIALQEGGKRLGVSLATGSGKTVIFTQLIDRVKPPTENATQTLILAHRRELVEQAARHCLLAYPKKQVDLEMAASHASGAADITVASIQSISSGDRMEKFDPDRFKLVLVDEAHHIVASQYLDVLRHFNLYPKPSGPAALIGVSATFSRHDGLKLGAAIDNIVFHRDFFDMIGDNWLADVLFTTVESKADLSSVGMGATGDFQTGALSKAVNTPELNDVVIRSWIARAKDRKSTLVFCVDLDHVRSLTAMFRKHGIRAEYITGNTHKTTRGEKLDAFKRGEFPVLLNCGVFTEGTDIPNIDCVVLARPTRSRNLLIQMMGRGMRLHPSKANCHIIDMVSSLETGIVTTPTLFGLDPEELVEARSAKGMQELRDRREQERLQKEIAKATESSDTIAAPIRRRHTISFTDYDSITDFVEDTSGEKHIRSISRNAWVYVGESRFILTSYEEGFLRLEKSDTEPEKWTVSDTARIPGKLKVNSPFMRPREIASMDSFERAIHAADTYANKIFPRFAISSNASWRRKPATESQLKFINKTRDEDSQLKSDMITKGAAMDMITKLKHGAKGRWKKIQAQKRQLAKIAESIARKRKLSEDSVKIGPLVARSLENS